MNWLRWGAIALFSLIIIATGLFAIFTPTTISDSAEEGDVIERITQAEGLVSHIEFEDISMVGDRVLVKANYIGDDNTQPQEAAEWHQLAETTANELYHEVARNRGVEVQLFQDSDMRAVAVAGL